MNSSHWKKSDLLYSNKKGFASNVHPLNTLLSDQDKIQFMLEFAEIMEGIRVEKEEVKKGFHRFINLMNSAN